MADSNTYSARRRLSLLLGGMMIFALGLIPLEPESAAEAPPQSVEESASAGASAVLARVGDEEITLSAVEEAAAAELLALERRRHEILTAHVEEQIRRRLLEAAAAKEGLDVESYVERRLNEISAEIETSEVEAYHAEKGLNQPLDQAGDVIRRRLARARLDAELESSHAVERRMEPFRVEVEAIGPSRGRADAPVTIVEFADFLCPFCGRAVTMLDEILAIYGDQVRIVVRQFPQDLHEGSQTASEAALCAARQGLFWEFHERAFSDQAVMEGDASSVRVIAESLPEIDAEAFQACLRDGLARDEIALDRAAGERLGVDRTPTFFVNGRMASGVVDFETLTALIDDELHQAERDRLDGDRTELHQAERD